MIKAKPLRTNQSQQISNLFAKRSRKDLKQKRIPKELQWLLISKQSKTTSLLFDIKPRHKESLYASWDQRGGDEVLCTELHKERETIPQQEGVRDTLDLPGLLTEISSNAVRRREKKVGFVKNQSYGENDQWSRGKRSYSQLKLREEVLNVELENKTLPRRPVTGVRHRSSISNCKESKGAEMEGKFSTAFRTTKINENPKATIFPTQESKDPRQPKSKRKRDPDNLCGLRMPRKPALTRHQKYQSLFCNFELKPWQNKQYNLYDDFNPN